MKRIILTVIFVLSLCIAHAQKYETTAPSGQSIYFKLQYCYGDDDVIHHYAKITFPSNNPIDPYYNHTKPTGVLVIPDSVVYNNIKYPVLEINEYCFYGCDSLLSVALPDAIFNIGDCAFSNCSRLEEVILPDSLNNIPQALFLGCTALNGIVIPDNVTSIGKRSFMGCSSLDSISFGSSISSVMDSAFMNCTGLPSIELPQSLVSISHSAFRGCTGITNLVIPDSVLSIDNYAFSQCTGITTLTLGKRLSSITSLTFSSCNNIETLNFNAENCGFMDQPFVWGGHKISTINIGSTVTRIPNKAFNGVDSLKSVVIPTSVSIIGSWAFTGCSNLVSVTCLPTTPPQIHYSDFSLQTFPAFDTSNINLRFHVPCQSIDAYDSAWGYDYVFDGVLVPYNYSLEVNDSIMGTAQGSICDSVLTVITFPHYGYHFSQWNDGNTDNPRTVFLTQDTSFTAIFSKNQYSLILQCNNESFGSVSGSGVYYYLDTIEISAEAIEHHHFVHWSDGSVDNPRQYLVSGDDTIMAIFAIDTVNVIATSSNLA